MHCPIVKMALNNLILTFSDLLKPKNWQNIRAFTDALNFPQNPSFVYHRGEKVNKIDPEVRQSKTCIVRDSNLLEFVQEEVVKAMNEKVKGKYVIRLARDYVTFIRYDPGDFFDWHIDFEKIQINGGENGFKEMHFLYCVQGPTEGGRLLVKERGHKVGEAPIKEVDAACTTNEAVVFDKLMEHMGEKVTAGSKIIMTIDVFVTTELRLKSGITEEKEALLGELLERKRSWINLEGNYHAWKQIWALLKYEYPKKSEKLIPFMQIDMKIGDHNYQIDATPDGIKRIAVDLRARYEKYYTNYYYVQETWYSEKGVPDPNKKKGWREPFDEVKWKELHKLLEERATAKADMPKNPGWNCQYDSKEMKNYRKNYRIWRLYQLLEKKNPMDLAYKLVDMFEEDTEAFQIESWPNIEDEFGPEIQAEGVKVINSLSEELSAENWSNATGGYTYHCNEANYDQFTVNYRYGFVRYSDELLNVPYYEHIVELEINENESENSDSEDY